MLGYLLLRRLQRRWARIVAVTGLGLLILAVAFSRIYLGAHWFSDVLGGLAVGTAWLAITVTPLEIVRRRNRLQRP
jgi:undecaprenyl-diphosphatase